MPSARQIYSKHLSGAVLSDKEIRRYTILNVEPKEIVDRRTGTKMQKLVVEFAEDNDIDLVLNRTNTEILIAKLGDDYSKWEGHKIEVRKIQRPFQGMLRDAIEVSVVD